ncbi:PEP synthetase regulatory protein, partial [Lacticaseibacillus paracasei subsp. paracasei Lpp71]
ICQKNRLHGDQHRHRSIEETATLILEHMGLDEFDNTETH